MTTHASRPGMTLLEIIIAVAILASVLAVAGQSMASGTNLSGTMRSEMFADDAANRAVAQVVRDLRSADNQTGYKPSVATDGQSITFYVYSGINLATGQPQREPNPRKYAYDPTTGLLTLTKDLGGTPVTDTLASALPPNAFSIQQSGSDTDVYVVTLTTNYTTADGRTISRTAKGQVFLRSGMINPAAASLVAGATTGGTGGSSNATGGGTTGGTSGGTTGTSGGTTGSTTGGTTGGTTGSTTGGTTGGSTTPVVPVVNQPTITISLTRSANGKDVTGTVIASVPTGDTIASLLVDVTAGTWSANTDSTSTATRQVKNIQITGVKNLDVTVSATAASGSGGASSRSYTSPQ